MNLVVEYFDKLSITPVETTRSESHFDKLSDHGQLVVELVETVENHFDKLSEQMLLKK